MVGGHGRTDCGKSGSVQKWQNNITLERTKGNFYSLVYCIIQYRTVGGLREGIEVGEALSSTSDMSPPPRD